MRTVDAPKGPQAVYKPTAQKKSVKLGPCSRWLSSRLHSWAACWPISSPCGAPRRRKSSSCPRQRPRLPAAPKPRNRNVKPLPVRQRAKQLLPVRLLPLPCRQRSSGQRSLHQAGGARQQRGFFQGGIQCSQQFQGRQRFQQKKRRSPLLRPAVHPARLLRRLLPAPRPRKT